MDIIYDILPLDIYLILQKYTATVIIQHNNRRCMTTFRLISLNSKHLEMLLDCMDVKLNIYLDSINSECVIKRYQDLEYDYIYHKISYLNNSYRTWIPDINFAYNATKKYFIKLDKSVIYNGIHTIHSDIIDYYIYRDKLKINCADNNEIYYRRYRDKFKINREDNNEIYYIKYIPNKKDNYDDSDYIS